MFSLFSDFKHGLRVLLKNPGFTAAAIIVLALGIGANTAIFSVVNAVLLRPLPFHDPARLVQVWHVPPPKSFPGMTQFAVSAANFIDWRQQNDVFDKMAIYTGSSLNLTGREQPEALQGAAVSADFFSTLQVQPMLGRSFTTDEDQQGKNHTVILSYGLWKSRFAANPNIAGQPVNLDGQPYIVAGVMAPKFNFPGWAQYWTPMGWTDKERAVRGEHHYLVIGRLKTTIPIPQAQAQMNAISSRLAQQYPEDDNGWGAVVIPLRDQLVSDVRPALLILLGAVAFVLLIACANVANLVLAKTFGRRKEIAIRVALGATGRRVIQQILAETLLLSLAGGALGLLLARFGIAITLKFVSDNLPKSTEVSLDGFVLAFTVFISIVTGVIAGLLPAIRMTKTNVNDALKQGLGKTDSDSAGRRTRSILVVSEVALSLILLVGAGLMIRSLWVLSTLDPGFDPHGVLTMSLVLPKNKYSQPIEEIAFFDRVLAKVRAFPGVVSAGLIDDLPLNNEGSHQPIAIEGAPVQAMSDQPEVDTRYITPGYLSTMHIPLRRGRDFSAADGPDRPSVALISESMARRFWPNQDPIGRHLTMTFSPDKVREIVGIVGDVKLDGMDAAASSATIYLAANQPSGSSFADWRPFPMQLAVRTQSQPASLVSAVTGAIHSIDRDQPVTDVMTMDDVVDTSLSQRRFSMLLLGAFAVLALLLAAVGIYSVLAFAVRRRVREIGIRVALGAEVKDILRLIVTEGMKPALIGLLLGVAGALALGKILASFIYGIAAYDPLTFAAVAMLLAAVALLASIIPAYRAARIEPTRALREE
ncbi:MAG TPA: ABC transporter permease [Verrucomicrobiae bacterium]|jgi:putative ABC transport system permease protein|nr:ABC transporter permease [Verrucomicrobiae bacterium]